MKIRRRRLAVSILAFLLILVPITLQGVASSVYQSPHISQHEFSPAGAGDMEVVPSVPED